MAIYLEYGKIIQLHQPTSKFHEEQIGTGTVFLEIVRILQNKR